MNAVGAGVVIALLPNALLGELLKFFKEGNHVLETIFQLVTIIQSFMAFIIGVLAAHQFKFKGTGAAIIGISAMLGSGAVHYNGQTIELKRNWRYYKCNFSSYISVFHLYVFKGN